MLPSAKAVEETIRWLEDNHEFEVDTPAEIFFEFVKSPDEYLDCHVVQEQVENGCVYIYMAGPYKSLRCNGKISAKNMRCSHHSQSIFLTTSRAHTV